jgi:hypothetical protein
MTLRRTARVGARVALPLGFTAALVGMAASPALAATNIAVNAGGNNLSDGAVLSQNDTINVKGTSDASTTTRQLKLTVSVPGSNDYTLKTGSAGPLQSGSLSSSVDTGCPGWSSSPCVEAVNGTYTFTFSAGSATTSTSVDLRVPPASPSSFTASVHDTVVSFAWSSNSEPDLMGYDISDSSGADVTPGGLDTDSVCGSNACGVSIDFGSGAQGTSDTFFLTARRHTSPSSSGFVASDPSAGQTVDFPAPAPPPSSPSGSSNGGSAGSPSVHGAGSGSTGGSTATSSGSSSTGGKHRPVTLTGRPVTDLRNSLPVVTAAGAPDLPSILTEVKPLPEGTYKPTLAYPDRTFQTKEKKPVAAPAQVLHSLQQVLNTKKLWQVLAGMAVLLLAAAHLRAFVERVDPLD